jgi:hypothetical protein
MLEGHVSLRDNANHAACHYRNDPQRFDQRVTELRGNHICGGTAP